MKLRFIFDYALLAVSFFCLNLETVFSSNFSAKNLDDFDNISVIEIEGNFDTPGLDSYETRERYSKITKEFYKTHSDKYDFIVFFTDFDFKMPQSEVDGQPHKVRGFYSGIKNDVKGIGEKLFDDSEYYGSHGKLQGIITMGFLGENISNPFDSDFSDTMTVLSHELLHRWGVSLKFIDKNGALSSDLLGHNNCHWSFFLDTGGSLMYGNNWHDNGNGTLTTTGPLKKYYSDLDLYVMGLIGKEDVKPFSLISGCEQISKNSLPASGKTVSGFPEQISIDQIIEAEGERIPSHRNSPKEFNIGAVLLVRPGTFKEKDIYSIKTIMNQWAVWFSALTDGKAVVKPAVFKVAGLNENPGVIIPETDPRELPPDIFHGISWLVKNQNSNGSWSDSSLTALRDSCSVLEALKSFIVEGETVERGIVFLKKSEISNIDWFIRKNKVLKLYAEDYDSKADFIKEMQNSDGGWGLGESFTSSVYDTAEVLNFLSELKNENTGMIQKGVQFLKSHQNKDGSFGETEVSGDIRTTAEVLKVFGKWDEDLKLGNQISKALEWLKLTQRPDGSFGGAVYETAIALKILHSFNSDEKNIDRGIDFLFTKQAADGSWENSSYKTALAVDSIYNINRRVDVSVDTDDITIEPESCAFLPCDIRIEAAVRNKGFNKCDGALVSLYIDSIIPENKIGEKSISLGGMSSEQIFFNYRLDTSGSHNFYVVLDENGTLNETNKINNTALKILPGSETFDFEITDGSVSVDKPEAGIYDDVLIKFSIKNKGAGDAYSVPITIYADNTEIYRLTADIMGGGSVEKEFLWNADITGEAVAIKVTADSDGFYLEADEENNSGFTEIKVNKSELPNLMLAYKDVSTEPEDFLEGKNAEISAVVHNNGFAGISDVEAELFLGIPSAGGILIDTRTLSHISSSSSENVLFSWNDIDARGKNKLYIKVRPVNGQEEIKENDNTLIFEKDIASICDLAVSDGSLSFDPLIVNNQNHTDIRLNISNLGEQQSPGFKASFYCRKKLIKEEIIEPLDGNSSKTYSFEYDVSGMEKDWYGISCILDEEGSVKEQDKANNKASGKFGIQDSDIFVTEKYISPNGDKIKDKTVFNFKLDEPSDVNVRIVDDSGKIVKKIHKPDFSDCSGGFAEWNGDDENGTVVFDGEYKFQLIDEKFGVIAEEIVAVDNNRLPVSEAVGTRYLLNKNISCSFREPQKVTWLSDESGILFYINSYSGEEYNKTGVYLMSPLGESVKLLTPALWQDKSRIHDFKLSPDESEVYISLTRNLDGYYESGIYKKNLNDNNLGLVIKEDVSDKDSKRIFDIRISPSNRYLSYCLNDSSKKIQEYYIYDFDKKIKSKVNKSLSYYDDFKSKWSPSKDKLAIYSCDNIRNLVVVVDEESQKVLIDNAKELSAFEWLDDNTAAVIEKFDSSFNIRLFNLLDPENELLIAENLSRRIKNRYYFPERKPFAIFNRETGCFAFIDDSEGYDQLKICDRKGSIKTLYKAGENDFLNDLCFIGPGNEVSFVKYSFLPDKSYKKDEYDFNDNYAYSAELIRAGKTINSYELVSEGCPVNFVNMPQDSFHFFATETGDGKIGELHYGNKFEKKYLEVDPALVKKAKDFFKVKILQKGADEAFMDFIALQIDGKTCYPVKAVNISSGEDILDEISEYNHDYSFMFADVHESEIEVSWDTEDIPGTFNNAEIVMAAKEVDYLYYENSIKKISESAYIYNGRNNRHYNSSAEGYFIKDLKNDKKIPFHFFKGKNSYYKTTDNLFLSPEGKYITYNAENDPECDCQEAVSLYILASLSNLTANLEIKKNEYFIKINGIASDKYFDRFKLEYSESDEPDNFKLIIPESKQAVFDDEIAVWVPPEPGFYTIRLTSYDMAGNKSSVSEKIYWNNKTSVSGLYSTSYNENGNDLEFHENGKFISPYTESQLSGFALHFTVNEPVNLEFVIFDSEGKVIKTDIVRYDDVPESGLASYYLWDGKDEYGSLVPDGRYMIKLGDHEYWTEIDRVMPGLDITDKGSIKIKKVLGGDRCDIGEKPYYSFMCSYYDKNFKNLSIYLDENSDGNWKHIRTLDNEKNNYEHRLFSEDFVSCLFKSRFRLVVRDFSGQEVSRIIPFNTDGKIFITRYLGSIKVEGKEVEDICIPFIDIGEKESANSIDKYTMLSRDTLDLQLETLVCGIPEKFVLEYSTELNPDGDEPDSKYSGWKEAKDSEIKVSSGETGHDISWVKPKDISDKIIALRIKAVDRNNIVYTSNIIPVGESFQYCYGRGLYDLILGRDKLTNINKLMFLIQSEAVDRSLCIEIPDREGLWYPYKTVNVSGGDILRPGFNNAIPEYRSLEEVYGEIKDFTITAEMFPDKNGNIVHESAADYCGLPEPQLVTEGYIQNQCGGVSEKIKLYANFLKTEAGFYENTEFEISVADGSGNEVENRIISIGAPVPEGVEETVLSCNDVCVPPISDGMVSICLSYSAYIFDLPKKNLKEGIYDADLILRNEYTEKRNTEKIIVDNTPPEFDVWSPEPFGFVCAKTAENPSDGKKIKYLEITGVIKDEFGWIDHDIYYKADDSEDGWHKGRIYCESDYKCRPSGRCSELSDFSNIKYLDVTDINSGTYSLKIEAWDKSGNKNCVLIPGVYISTSAGFDLITEPDIISPNGDGMNDSLEISYKLKNPDFIKTDIVVYENGIRKIIDNAVSKYIDSEEETIFWGESGITDGKYYAEIFMKDKCGNNIRKEREFEIDNTYPVVELYSDESDFGGAAAEIKGKAADKNFKGYILKASSVLDQGSEFIICSGKTPVSGENGRNFLGSMKTAGLSGEWELILEAEDAAGNISEARKIISVPEKISFISFLELEPFVFSPNKDGFLDELKVIYGLDSDSDEKFHSEIVFLKDGANQAGAASDNISTGENLYKWNGLRDGAAGFAEDGKYKCVLKVWPMSDSSDVREESLTFFIDTEKPHIEFDSLENNSFFNKDFNLKGSIDDLHIESVKIKCIGENKTEFEKTYSQSRNNYVFHRFQNQSDGEYYILVEAEDKGGNKNTETVKFTIDKTQPEINILSPGLNSVYGGKIEKIEFKAEVEEKYLKDWKLFWSRSEETDSDLFTIASGEIIENGFLSYSWKNYNDLGLDDGDYYLVLKVRDKAGNETSEKIKFVIDNTKPVIETESCDEFITEKLEIKGSLYDLNFKEAKIFLGRGSCAEELKYSELKNFDKPVSAGLILSTKALPDDGKYCIKLSAADIAGNYDEKKLGFTVDTIPPEPPALSGRLEDESAKLEWTVKTSDEIKGFNIYRDGKKINSGILTSAYYNDSEMSGGRNLYNVTSIDRAGLESAFSNPVQLYFDNEPPEGIIAWPVNNSEVSFVSEIKGKASSKDDFREYRIYTAEGKTPADIDFKLVKTSSVPVSYGVLAELEWFLKNGEFYTVKLEAEDLTGNKKVVKSVFKADREAPSAPVLISAVLNGKDSEIKWEANSEDDIAGYLVYRNKKLVNGPESVSDIFLYLIDSLEYTDKNINDGKFGYYVRAVDRAGNISSPSQTLSVTADNHPPHLMISSPQNGETFDSSFKVTAETKDTDIKTAQFEFREEGQSEWASLGNQLCEIPYEAVFDPELLKLEYGIYEIRVLSEDLNGNTDNKPDKILIRYSDLIPPGPPLDLDVKVNGSIAVLNWSENKEEDLDGYNIYYLNKNSFSGESAARINKELHKTCSFTIENLDEQKYEFMVSAVDIYGNESLFSQIASCIIYSPELDLKLLRTQDSEISVAGKSLIPGEATLYKNAGAVLKKGTDERGFFNFNSVSTDKGWNLFSVSNEDYYGNISKKSLPLKCIRLENPSAPKGLSVKAEGHDSILEWLPNPEEEMISGYKVFRNGIELTENGFLYSAKISASDCYGPSNSFDNDLSTYCMFNLNSEFLSRWEADMESDHLISGVEIYWGVAEENNRYSAKNYNIELKIDDDWVVVKKIRNNEKEENYINFESFAEAEKIRITLLKSNSEVNRWGFSQIRLREVRLKEIKTVKDLNFTDQGLENGIYSYQISAVNIAGYESLLSEKVVVTVGDINAPVKPENLCAEVIGSDAFLTWDFDSDEESVFFNIYRSDSGDWVRVNENKILEKNFTETKLSNGEYQYLVRASDQTGNESPPSNAVSVFINLPVPENTEIEGVKNNPEGNGLYICWKENENAAGYNIYRALNPEGEKVRINPELLGSNCFYDSGVENGITYYYFAVSVDESGNESSFSEPFEAVSSVLIPMKEPVITLPLNNTDTLYDYADIYGTAERGSVVSLFHDYLSEGSVFASSGYEKYEKSIIEKAGSIGFCEISPDGRKAVYSLEQADKTDIILFDLETDEKILEKTDASNLLKIEWNEDSSRFYYLYLKDTQEGSKSCLRVFDCAEKNSNHVSENVLKAQWSALGTLYYVFHESSENHYSFNKYYSFLNESFVLYATENKEINDFNVSKDESSAVIATVDEGSSSLSVFDLNNKSLEIFKKISEAAVNNPEVSSDGSFISFYWSDEAGKNILEIVETDSYETVRKFEFERAVAGTSWSDEVNSILVITRDSQNFFLSQYFPEDNYYKEIGSFAGSGENISSGEDVFRFVSWSYDGRRVSYFDPLKGILTVPGAIPEAASLTGLEESPDLLGNLRNTENGFVCFIKDLKNESAGKLVNIKSGSFRFEKIFLSSGKNIFKVNSLKSGKEKWSKSVNVFKSETSLLPDLLAESKNITFFPSPPVSGEKLIVGCKIRNTGPADSGSFAVLIEIRDSFGNLFMTDTKNFNELKSGASQDLSFSFDTEGYQGLLSFQIFADPQNLIKENSEKNNSCNKDLIVPGNTGLCISAALDSYEYDTEDSLSAVVDISNRGDSLNGELSLFIESSAGEKAATIDRMSLELEDGYQERLYFIYDLSDFSSGDYFVRTVFQGDDGVVSEKTNSFKIKEDIRVETEINLSKSVFEPDEDVSLNVSQINSGKSFISSGLLSCIIYSPDNLKAFEEKKSFSSFFPKDLIDFGFSLNTSGYGPGTYRIETSTEVNGTTVSKGLREFEINGASFVTGNIGLEKEVISQAENINYDLIVKNSGNSDAENINFHVFLLSSENTVPVDSKNFVLNLASGEEKIRKTGFETAAFAPGLYSIVLKAGEPDNLRILSKKSFSIKDIRPPVMEVLSPYDGEVINKDFYIRIHALDKYSSVERAEFRIDGSKWLELVCADASKGLYTYFARPDESQEGLRTLSFRAADIKGNVSGEENINILIEPSAELKCILSDDVLNADSDLQIDLTTFNTGWAKKVELETFIRNQEGEQVYEFDSIAAQLEKNGSQSFSHTWNSGRFLSGEYKLVSRIMKGSAIISEAVEKFSIIKSADFSVNTYTDKNEYTTDENVNIGCSLESLCNYSPAITAVELVIRDSKGRVVDEQEKEIENIAPGELLEFQFLWNTENFEAGLYNISVQISADGEKAGLSESGFKINPVLKADGSMILSSGIVYPGETLNCEYQLENMGNASVNQGKIEFKTISESTGETVFSEEKIISLLYSATDSALFSVNTSGFTSGKYRITAVFTNGGEILCSSLSFFEIADNVPPVIQILSPEDGKNYKLNVPLRVEAVDEVSGIDRVEFRAESGEWEQMNKNAVNDDIYSKLFVPDKDFSGSLSIAFRAFDKCGNCSLEKSVTVEIEKSGAFMNLTGGIIVSPVESVKGSKVKFLCSINNPGSEPVDKLTVSAEFSNSASGAVAAVLKRETGIEGNTTENIEFEYLIDEKPGSYTAFLKVKTDEAEESRILDSFDCTVMEAPSVDVDKNIYKDGVRLLVWVNDRCIKNILPCISHCPSYEEESEEPDCNLSSEVCECCGCIDLTLLEQILSGSCEYYRIVNSECMFAKEIRNPFYTDIMILGNHQFMLPHTAAELTEKVNSGTGIISSLWYQHFVDFEVPVLSSVFGVRWDGFPLFKGFEVKADESFLGGEGIIFPEGPARKVEALAGTQIAGWIKPESNFCEFVSDDMYPGIVLNHYGKGKSVYFAFDLGMSLNSANYEKISDLISGSVLYVHDYELQDGFLPLEVVPVEVSLMSDKSGFRYKITESFSENLRLYEPGKDLFVEKSPFTEEFELKSQVPESLRFNFLTPLEKGRFFTKTESELLFNSDLISLSELDFNIEVLKNRTDYLDEIVAEIQSMEVPFWKILIKQILINKVEAIKQRDSGSICEIELNIRSTIGVIHSLILLDISEETEALRQKLDRFLNMEQASFYFKIKND